MEKESTHNNEYERSKHRCPICGTVIGCLSEGEHVVCSLTEFQQHVAKCREANRVKPGRIRYEETEQ